MWLATTLGTAALVWPVALGLALVDRLDGHPSLASSVAYVAASRVCHQRADRSFHSGGQQWPVCARCAGLYLAAPLGVLVAVSVRVGRRSLLARGVLLAALPTAVAWVAEAVVGLPVPAAVRFAAAVPLGAAVTFALIDLTRID
jgi:uncharacterized membrane protein